MTPRCLTVLGRTALIGAAMLATSVAANAEPTTLNCTLIGPNGGDSDVLKIDAAANTATWKTETGKIQVQEDNILFLGWHSFDVASFDKQTGNFGYSVKTADGQRRFTQTRACQKA